MPNGELVNWILRPSKCLQKALHNDLNASGKASALAAFFLPVAFTMVVKVGKRCVNRGVAYRVSAEFFFKDHGRRFSMSSTDSACGSAVKTRRRYP